MKPGDLRIVVVNTWTSYIKKGEVILITSVEWDGVQRIVNFICNGVSRRDTEHYIRNRTEPLEGS